MSNEERIDHFRSYLLGDISFHFAHFSSVVLLLEGWITQDIREHVI